MYGRIFGFHRLARCPKCTPASIRSFTWTIATHCPPSPARGARGHVRTRFDRATTSLSARVPVGSGEDSYRSNGRGRRSKGFEAELGSEAVEGSGRNGG